MKRQPVLLAGALAVLLGISIPFAVRAQEAQAPASAPNAAPAHRGGYMRMLDQLGLSDQQRSQIKGYVDQFRQQHPEGSAPDVQARKALRDQIMSVLTPDQRATLQSKMRAMRERRSDSASPVPSASPA